jgi:DNA invertase Pin-like site-specific DNA recombinase
MVAPPVELDLLTPARRIMVPNGAMPPESAATDVAHPCEVVGGDQPFDGDRRFRAAQYVRMSTEYQQYSTANQMAAIADYAAVHGLEIVRTYSDEARSGLSIKWRPGLRQMLADVIGGRADYGTVLVYDVSRWGRFQDPDESAYYEFVCRKEGVHVEYCAEPFRNDLSGASSLMKNIKRMMAAEFSRELSVKVYEGKIRVASTGVSVGSRAPFGMRRMLVDASGKRRGILEMGESKFSATDRIILVPGPAAERALIRWIFRQAARGVSPLLISRDLAGRGVLRPSGRRWHWSNVRHTLKNQKYMGTLTYNRRSARLHSPCVTNPPEKWVTIEGAFEPVVDPDLFRRAQACMGAQVRYPEAQALVQLRALLDREGRLTEALIDAEPGMPCSIWYRDHFGGLRAAYARVGYAPARNTGFSEGRAERHKLAQVFRGRVLEGLARLGVPVEVRSPIVMVLDGRLRLGVTFARFKPWRGLPRWKAQVHVEPPQPDWLLIARLNPLDTAVMDQSVIAGGQVSIALNAHRHWGGRVEERFADLDAALRRLAGLAGMLA